MALELVIAACATPCEADPQPPPDARWVASLYPLRNGGADGCLALISDLVDAGAVEVIGDDADSTAEMLSSPAHPALLLAGTPDALALAHERLAGEGTPGGQVRAVIGFALCMAVKDRRQSARPAGQGPDRPWSVVLVQDVDRLDAVLTRIAASPHNLVRACPRFLAGTSSGTGTRTLLMVEADWQDLRLLTEALHTAEIPFRGFLYCQRCALLSAPMAP